MGPAALGSWCCTSGPEERPPSQLRMLSHLYWIPFIHPSTLNQSGTPLILPFPPHNYLLSEFLSNSHKFTHRFRFLSLDLRLLFGVGDLENEIKNNHFEKMNKTKHETESIDSNIKEFNFTLKNRNPLQRASKAIISSNGSPLHIPPYSLCSKKFLPMLPFLGFRF